MIYWVIEYLNRAAGNWVSVLFAIIGIIVSAFGLVMTYKQGNLPMGANFSSFKGSIGTVKSGSIDIIQYIDRKEDNRVERKWYEIDIYNPDGLHYIPYIAVKGEVACEETYRTFGDLYKAIWTYYESLRSKQIDALYNDLMQNISKQK